MKERGGSEGDPLMTFHPMQTIIWPRSGLDSCDVITETRAHSCQKVFLSTQPLSRPSDGETRDDDAFEIAFLLQLPPPCFRTIPYMTSTMFLDYFTLCNIYRDRLKGGPLVA